MQKIHLRSVAKDYTARIVEANLSARKLVCRGNFGPWYLHIDANLEYCSICGGCRIAGKGTANGWIDL